MRTKMIFDPYKVNDRKCITIYMTHRCQLRCGYCYVGCNQEENKDVLLPDMSLDVQNKVVEYIADLFTKFKPGTSVEVTLSGGEVGLLDPLLVIDFVNKLKAIKNPNNLNVLFSITTNLTYKITENHWKLFKIPGMLISTTFDGGVRFENKQEEKLWYHNLQLLKDNGIKADIVFILSKQLLENYSPEWCYSLVDTYNLVSTDMFQVLLGRTKSSKRNYEKLRATNLEVNKWLFHAFLAYETWENETVENSAFEAIKQALVGNPFYCYSRTCSLDQLNIQPDGKVYGCDFCFCSYLDNVVQRLPDAKERQHTIWIKEQNTLTDRCKACKYLKWCRGGCFSALSDETDCGVPHQIFEYLITKYGID